MRKFRKKIFFVDHESSVKIPSFSNKIAYPHRSEKIDHADSENRAPFRNSCFPKQTIHNFFESHKKCFCLRNVRMSETRRFERPRSSRSQHSNPGGASCLFEASVAQNSRGYDLSQGCARTTAGASRIRMLWTRASGTLRASRLSCAQLSSIFENCAGPQLDVLSVPEALVHSIRILEAPAVYLKHRWLKS